MKIERLYAITVYLLNHGRTSANELAKYFEVSVRTIQRDIDSLCLAGIPIISVTGATGGYEISSQFKLDKHLATSNDYSYILTALKGLVSATNDQNANHTLEKISHIFKQNNMNIILDFSVLREGEQDTLQTLQTAIAQKRMVASMPSGQGRKIKRSKQSNFQKRITRLSRNLKWSRKRLIRVGIIAGVLIFGLLFVVNLGLDYYSSQQALQEEANRKAELAEKEAETERLAQQRQQEAQKEDIVIENTSTNTYTITNVLENSTPLELEITLPLDSTVVIYNDGEVITGDTSTIYSDTFKKEITVDKECTLEIEIGSYSANQFYVNGNNLAFDENYWYPGEPAYLDIIIKANEQTGE